MYTGTTTGEQKQSEKKKTGLQKAVAVAGLLMALLVLGLHAALTPLDPVSMASGVAATSSGDALAPFWSDSDFAPANARAAKADEEGVVYSYSVIPGGVTSAQKLRAALQRDPIAAAHYSDFDVESAYVVRLARERKVHVSYRMGDSIFWTKKEVTLRAGETLLSDGEHLARTRCGNRVAMVPDGPTSPLEPPVEVIDAPVFPHPPAITTDAIPAGPIWSDHSTPVLLAYGGVPVAGVPAGGPPYLPPVPVGSSCCGSGSPTKGGGSQSPQPPPTTTPLPPPASTPPGPPTSTPPPTPGQPTPPVTPPSTPPPSATPPSSPTPPSEPTPPSNPFPTPPGPPAPTPTPEPSSLLLLVIGLAGALFLIKTRRP